MNSFEVPVAIFAYNRDKKFKTIYESLIKNLNKNVPIYFFIDGPKNKTDIIKINNILGLIENENFFEKKYIIKNKKNLGLKKNIINGINTVFKYFTKIIVIEDDILINKYFYKFMSENLNNLDYKNNLGSITGYSFLESKIKNYKYDIYFSFRHSSWGWGTWKHVWENINFENIKNENFRMYKNKLDQAGTDIYRMLIKDKKIDMNSWSIYFDYYCITHNLLCLSSSISMIKNIGFDNDATNTKKNYDENFNYDYLFYPKLYPNSILIDKNILNQIKIKYSRSLKKLIKKILCI